jgi:hypothetical protein
MNRTRAFILVGLMLALTACIAKQSPSALNANGPGFLEGVLHGFVFPVAWLISLFTDQIAIYAVPNNGGWYNFGYFIGVCFLGVGARNSKRRGP